MALTFTQSHRGIRKPEFMRSFPKSLQVIQVKVGVVVITVSLIQVIAAFASGIQTPDLLLPRQMP